VILSDGEIRQAIADGHINFTPALSEEYLSEALTTSALDLRLGDELQYYAPLAEVAPVGLADAVVIDPSTPRVIPDLITKWGRKRSIADDHYDLPHTSSCWGQPLNVSIFRRKGVSLPGLKERAPSRAWVSSCT
jgi:hypothetical protein